MFLTAFPPEQLFSAGEARPEAPAADLPARLRQAIGAAHAAIEALPASRAMLEGRIRRQSYAVLLGQLWYVHGCLESRLTGDHPAAALFTPEMSRAAVILRDLQVLGGGVGPVAGATRQMVDALTAEAERSPWTLLGALYVLEGSRMGSMVLARPLARALGVAMNPGCGLDYHLDGAADRPRTWGRFKASLAMLPLSEADQAAAVRGAAVTMDGLFAVYAEHPPSPVPS
jgi:heme oxygenase